MGDPTKPYFDDFLKRMEVAGWLEETLGVTTRLPETELAAPAGPDFLTPELELADGYDLIVALQPLETRGGAPTLLSELNDLGRVATLRSRVFLFQPDGERWNTFDAIASRLVASQVHSYRPDVYRSCKEIRDRLEAVVDVVKRSKALGIWPASQ